MTEFIKGGRDQAQKRYDKAITIIMITIILITILSISVKHLWECRPGFWQCQLRHFREE